MLLLNIIIVINVLLNPMKNDNKIPIFFITGTSGSGKTTLMNQLKKTLPSCHYVIYDFDENGVPENADKKWRVNTTKLWLNKAQENYGQQKITIICGVSVPSEVNGIIDSNQLSFLPYFGFIKVEDMIIKKRLKKRGWDEQLINDNLNWAKHLEKETVQQKNYFVVDYSATSTPKNIADHFSAWIENI